MGLPRGNRLYTPLGGDGEPLVMPDAGLVLTRKLAQILHARPGDSLRLRSYAVVAIGFARLVAREVPR